MMTCDELETNGYTIIAETKRNSYDWEIFLVAEKDGVLWWASDSGCSCNSPWDSTSFPEGFRGHGTAHDAIKALHEWGGNSAGTPVLEKLLAWKPA